MEESKKVVRAPQPKPESPKQERKDPGESEQKRLDVQDVCGESTSGSDQQPTTSIYDLTDDVLLEIFWYLPFEEQVRIGRVDKNLRRISQICVSKMKSLKLGVHSGRLESISTDSLKVILDLCVGGLQCLRLAGTLDGRSTSLLQTLAAYSFPQLAVLEIETWLGYFIFNESFVRLIAKNSNLRKLLWTAERRFSCIYPAPVFPDGIFPNLEIVAITPCDDDTLHSMVGKVPNLKAFDAVFSRVNALPVVDEFFFTVPKMEELRLSSIDYGRLTNFWKLQSLVSLDLRSSSQRVNDDVLTKIAISFPLLQYLGISNTESISAAGIKALAWLKELYALEITDNLSPSDDVDVGLRQLSMACSSLVLLNVQLRITPITFLSFFRFCPELKYFKVAQIFDMYSPYAVVAMLSSVGELGNRDFILGRFQDDKETKMWHSEPVNTALEKLKEHGVVIEIQKLGEILSSRFFRMIPFRSYFCS